MNAEPPNDYAVRTSDWIRAGRDLVQAHPGLLVGATVLIMLMQGLVAGTILVGPLIGGVYWLNLRLLRGEQAEFADAFAGFRRGFAPLLLVHIIVSLVMLGTIVPGAVGLRLGLALWESQSAIALPVVVGGGLLALAGGCVGVYWSVSWVFAPALVVDRQMDFWPAMQLSARQVRKHWWGVFGFFLQAGLLNVVGLLFCLVGFFFTAPIVLAAIARAYEELFGSRPAPSA